jgi:hypothetical protein
VIFLIGGVDKGNENILCRRFLFLLKRKTKAQLQQSHCEISRSRKCEAVQKSPFWTLRISDSMAPGASDVFIGLPSERGKKKKIRNMKSPCCVCVCVCVRARARACVHVVSTFEQVCRISQNCPTQWFLRTFAYSRKPHIGFIMSFRPYVRLSVEWARLSLDEFPRNLIWRTFMKFSREIQMLNLDKIGQNYRELYMKL